MTETIEKAAHRHVNSLRHQAYWILPLKNRGKYEDRWFEIMEYLRDAHPAYRAEIDFQIAQKKKRLAEAKAGIVRKGATVKDIPQPKPERRLQVVKVTDEVQIESFRQSLESRLKKTLEHLNASLKHVEKHGVDPKTYTAISGGIEMMRRIERDMGLFHILIKAAETA